MALKGFKSRLAKGADDPFTRYYIACLHALRGDADKALDSLELSFKSLAPINRVRAPIDPDLESLRENPRFRRLLSSESRIQNIEFRRMVPAARVIQTHLRLLDSGF